MKRWLRRNALWCVGFAVVGFLAVAEFAVVHPTLKDGLGWLGTVTSTFAGAAIAFWFNAVRAAQDREDKDVAAGNMALVTLIEILDRQLQYKASLIDPVLKKPDAWFSLQAGSMINVDFEVDKTSLSFLLEKHPDAWRSVVLEEMRFATLRKGINERTEIINTQVWPKLEAKGFKHGQSISTNEIESTIGPIAAQQLKNTSRFIIDSCIKNIDSVSQCIADLRNNLALLYPARKFVPMPNRLKLV